MRMEWLIVSIILALVFLAIMLAFAGDIVPGLNTFINNSVSNIG